MFKKGDALLKAEPADKDTNCSQYPRCNGIFSTNSLWIFC
jgi:hypothetical protein